MKNVILFLLLFLTFNFSFSQNTLPKYKGNFGEHQLKHLLRRTLFGATMDDMKHFKGKSMDAVVDELLAPLPEPEPPLWNFTTNPYSDVLKVGEPWINTSAATMWNVSALNLNTTYWWTKRLLQQDRNIREKMIMFFENHLPSNTGKDVVGYQKFHYERIKLLSQYATGNYKDLINIICTNAAMMTYLDHKGNSAYKKVGGQEVFIKPNENFARELQEIYTVGKGSKNNQQLFTESDVEAAAEILTGWHTCNIENPNNDHNITAFINRWCKDGANWTVQYAPAEHSRNNKQFSSFYNNKTINYIAGNDGGQKEIDQLVDMLFERKETSENLVRKLYRYFVYAYISDEVEQSIIQPLAQIMRQGVNGSKPYEIKDILKIILTSEHFYDKENIGVMIKNPVDFSIGLFRMFGAKQFPDTTRTSKNDLLNYSSNYGHYVTAQSYIQAAGIDFGGVPDVAGYPAYYQHPDYHHHWLNAQTMRNRKAIVAVINPGDTLPSKGFLTIGKKHNINYQRGDKSILLALADQFEDQGNVDKFIQQNIDYLLVNDLNEEEKTKLRNILEVRGFNVSWQKAWQKYLDTGSLGCNEIYRKLLLFYEALLGYAEFQLM